MMCQERKAQETWKQGEFSFRWENYESQGQDILLSWQQKSLCIVFASKKYILFKSDFDCYKEEMTADLLGGQNKISQRNQI